MAVEARLVDDRPHPGQGGGSVPGDGVSEEAHRAGVRAGEPEQHPDERGLARTIGSQVAEGAAPGNQKFDAVDRHVVAEPLGEPVGLHGPLAVEITTAFRPCCHGDTHRPYPVVTAAMAITGSTLQLGHEGASVGVMHVRAGP